MTNNEKICIQRTLFDWITQLSTCVYLSTWPRSHSGQPQSLSWQGPTKILAENAKMRLLRKNNEKCQEIYLFIYLAQSQDETLFEHTKEDTALSFHKRQDSHVPFRSPADP